MSRMEIYAFNKDGDSMHYGDARNAWGGAMLIWQSLSERYGYEMSLGLLENMPVWEACIRGELSDRDCIACAFTFDRCWVKSENIPRLTEALESFARDFVDGMDKPPTLREAVEVLKQAYDDPDVIGIGFNQTSVAECLWQVFDRSESFGQEPEEPRPYNLNRDEGHWELFDYFPPPQKG